MRSFGEEESRASALKLSRCCEAGVSIKKSVMEA